MKTKDDVMKRFQSDTKNHTMEVRLDNGLYRHLVFTNNGSNIYRFDIVTYPGYLVMSGDMGEWVFTRLADMFEFFRGKDINPSYWGGKCVASKDGIREYSAERAKEYLQEQYFQYLEDHDKLTKARRNELEDAFREITALCDEESGERAMVGLYDHVQENEDDLPYLADFWEAGTCLRDYKHHYLWACYAIQWAINTYDKKEGKC